MSEYTLMHKDVPVADLELDAATGVIRSTGAVYHSAHLPVGVPMKKGSVDRSSLNNWWCGRSIPASRSGIRTALAELNLSDTRLLLEKCLGLSLSDQYWIRPAASSLSWEKINFFENPFSEDVGNILFGKRSDHHNISLMSPDNTSDGWLKKKWKIINGKRCLIKAGSGATQQEPYNEVLASRIMERLQIPHVSYDLLVEDEYPYSVCEDFITTDTELVTAWYLMQTEKKPNHISVYSHYRNCCERLGIPDIRISLDQMLVLDYLIVNEDRHLNNFGVIRDADTLEYLGAAPLYDNGTSLWFDKPLPMINAGGKPVCKPFKSSHEEQIRLVTDFSWIDFSALHGIDEEFCEITRDSIFINDDRRDALCRALLRRVDMLQHAALSVKKTIFADSTRFDVTRNIEYSGDSEE